MERLTCLISHGLVGFCGMIGLGEEIAPYEVTHLLTASSPSYSRSEEWKPGDGIALEISGMEWLGDTLAVSIRKGEVWLIDHVLSGDPRELEYHLFASGLHEPLGVTRDGDDLLVSQRAEVTRLQDLDGDRVADAYLTECDGWGLSGNYHAYTYGPERDGEGQLWVTLNLDIGRDSLVDNSIGWRGWGGIIGKDGRFVPKALGMRSPCGLGANREGDMFFSDQQGNWIPATPVYHLREGVFYGSQKSLESLQQEDAPFRMELIPSANQLYPDALKSSPEFVPPAVWLPYNKMGRSGTDIELIEEGGKFGPFDGQLLVGEFTNTAINRVFLEKVNGEYQGACFPFISGFPAAVLRLNFAPDGSLAVGMTNRGWSSLGNRSYGLSLVRFGGETPFAIQEMRAKSDGFELLFTKPIEETLEGVFSVQSYTYNYSSSYGGEEVDQMNHHIESVKLAPDGKTVRLTVADLRAYYVHELRADRLKAKDGSELMAPDAYYTLNQIPKE
ncbi:MAG: hypothetical protein AAGA96_17525 [Verrucomicrobiota bacterium]